MFVIVRDVVRHANLNEPNNYKISLHLSIQDFLALVRSAQRADSDESESLSSSSLRLADSYHLGREHRRAVNIYSVESMLSVETAWAKMTARRRRARCRS